QEILLLILILIAVHDQIWHHRASLFHRRVPVFPIFHRVYAIAQMLRGVLECSCAVPTSPGRASSPLSVSASCEMPALFHQQVAVRTAYPGRYKRFVLAQPECRPVRPHPVWCSLKPRSPSRLCECCAV